jgi:DNA-binding beta-propeller fold protein YncE
MKFTSTLICLLLSINLFAQHSLGKLWQTDSTLKTPESVLYDAKSKTLFVANIGDFQKEGTGFISKLGLDGKIITRDWVTGLTAAKGMGLHKNLLYVTELTAVAVIDVNTASVTQRIKVENAKFLNDITIDSKGVVYVSDYQAGKVLKIEDGKVSDYLENLKNPNGLLAVGSDLYVLADGSLLKVDASRKSKTLAEGMENSTDGIEMVKENEFLVSSWAGVIYYVKADGSKQLLLDTREKKANTADIGYDPKNRIVYVPTFMKNSVVAYKLK